MSKHGRTITSGITSAILIVGAFSPGASGENSDSSAIKMATRIDGEIVFTSEVQIAESVSQLPPSGATASRGTEVAPQLIGFNQWVDCFSLNNENGVFAEYNHFYDGVGQDVRLKCGNNTWGYKHIRSGTKGDNGKESLWQAKLDGARAAGWDAEAQGVESWDDLMAASAGNVITWPEYRAVNPVNKKTCGVTEIIFVNMNTGEIVYSYLDLVIWSNTNDRLLTTYPQPRSTCYPS